MDEHRKAFWLIYINVKSRKVPKNKNKTEASFKNVESAIVSGDNFLRKENVNKLFN